MRVEMQYWRSTGLRPKYRVEFFKDNRLVYSSYAYDDMDLVVLTVHFARRMRYDSMRVQRLR